MKVFEKYIDEIVNVLWYYDNLYQLGKITERVKGGIMFERGATLENIKEILLSEVEEPSIEMSKYEYDFMSCLFETGIKLNQFDSSILFKNFESLMHLQKEYGWYKNVNDTSMCVSYILDKAKIVILETNDVES